MKSPRTNRIRPFLSIQLFGALLSLGAFPAVTGDAASPAQGTTPPPKLQFVIRLKPVRPDASATEEDKAKITQHFEYLKNLLAEGKLLLAGLALDDYSGIVVVETQTRLEAEKLMVMDPAVRAGVFLAELHPFRVALLAAGR